MTKTIILLLGCFMVWAFFGCQQNNAPMTPREFRFLVKEVFYIKPPVDRVILVGMVEEGTIHAGESALLIHTPLEVIPVTIETIETVKNGEITTATKGQQAGLRLQGIRLDQIRQGDLVVSVASGQTSRSPTSTQATQLSFQLPRGIRIADSSGIHEGYEETKMPQGHWTFRINVSAENIPRVFKRLAQEVGNPGFFLLEVGTHRDEEAKLRKQPSDPFHKDVYYLDGQNTTQALAIFDAYRDLLVHDGMVNIGFGSHQGKDEVFVGGYKIFEVYADHPEKYRTALKELGFRQEKKLRTVWDNFTLQSPGERNVLKDSSKTIWDMVEELKAKGLYFAEHRED